jgi:hypothetical protein
VRTFSFLLLPEDDFVATPSSLAFLAEAGLDFK